MRVCLRCVLIAAAGSGVAAQRLDNNFCYISNIINIFLPSISSFFPWLKGLSNQFDRHKMPYFIFVGAQLCKRVDHVP